MDVSPLLLNEAVMPRFLTEAHQDSSSSTNQKRDPRETVQTNRAIDPWVEFKSLGTTMKPKRDNYGNVNSGEILSKRGASTYLHVTGTTLAKIKNKM